jgi:uncharacterized protein (DUF2267 family)
VPDPTRGDYHSTFIATVEDYAGVDCEEAERAIRATPGERLTDGEVRDIAAYLPDELRPFLRSGEPARRSDLRDFLRRVSERAGVPMPTAARYARAVFTALGRAIPRREQRDLAAQLPDDFAALLETIGPGGRARAAAAGPRAARPRLRAAGR